MNITLKVGSRVRRINGQNGRFKEGATGTIIRLSSDGDSADVKIDGGLGIENGNDTNNLVLISKPAKKIKVNFILAYLRNNIDQVEEFKTLKDVKTRIAELMDDSRVSQDSYKVYEVKKNYVVKAKMSKSIIIK